MRFHLLGPLEVHAESGKPVRLSARPAKLLTALLLDADQAVPMDRLVDVLWPDAPPTGATKLVRNCMSLLRTALEAAAIPATVQTLASGYRLRTGAEDLDVAVFRRTVSHAADLQEQGRLPEAAQALRAALSLWRGPALAGLDCPALHPSSVHLDEQRLTALERCHEIDLALGRHQAVIGSLTELTRTHPLREQFVGQLMTALYRADRRADALAEYQRLRAALHDQLGLDPGRSIRDLHLRILRDDLPAVTTVAAPAGSPETDRPPARAVPRQLPAQPTHFSGRSAELATLDRIVNQLADGAPVVISAISGMGGVGKTSLAVCWGHLARDGFPDGDLYVDLHGHHAAASPLAAGEVLGRFLRSLGTPPERIPVTADERGALFRSLMAGRRMLVLLDNAVDSAQVRPLLPGAAGCAVLVTSRTRLTGLSARDGAHNLPLDVLPRNDALRLLGRIIGERTVIEPGATAALADLCGYLPLALRIAAERVNGHPAMRVADAVTELTDRATRLDLLSAADDPQSAVGTVLRWSYDRLGPPARSMFRMLSAIPGADITVDAGAALAGTTHQHAAELLEQLHGAHLLDRSGDRYRMHDLLRLLAAELPGEPDDEPGTAYALPRRRILTWYLRSATGVRTTLDPYLPPMPPQPDDPAHPAPEFPSLAAALAWADAERDNLVAAVALAVDINEDELAWQTATALYPYFEIRKYYQDWISTHEHGIAAAARLGDGEAHGRLLCNLGSAYRTQQLLTEATACYTRAYELFGTVGYRQGQAKVLGNLASTYQERNDLEAAITTGTLAVERFRDLHDAYGEALSLTNLGRSLHRAGRARAAIAHHRRAHRLFLALADERGQARAIGNMGAATLTLGHPALSIDLLRRAASLFAHVGDRYEEALTGLDLADAYHVLGCDAEAATYGRRASKYFEEIGDTYMIATARRRLAFLRSS